MFEASKSIRAVRLLVALSIVLSSALFSKPVLAETMSREQVEQIILDYLTHNPEIVANALDELQRRAQASADAKRSEIARREQETLQGLPHDVVLGNPRGDVTIVEFFDFNCGYCKQAAPDIKALIDKDPNLRVVLKDFPVLGEGSLQASSIGLAVKFSSDNAAAEKFHNALISQKGRIDGARALELVDELGLDRQAIEAQAGSQKIRDIITANFAIASTLGLTGTPAFIIGDQVIEGAVGKGPLADVVAKMRKGK